jgi:hypothetical protein
VRGAIALSLILLVPLLAGCGGPSVEASADDTVAAGTLLQKALAYGQAWNEQARLVGVGSAEYRADSNVTAEVEKEREQSPEVKALLPSGDPSLGDGKAVAWEYSFVAPDKKVLVIVLVRSGEVTFRRESSISPSVKVPPDLSNFTVDSDQAASLAALKQQVFADLKPSADASNTFLQRSSDTNRTEWLLALHATPADTGIPKTVVVLVDARSGAVRLSGTSGTVNRTKVPPPPQEAGAVGGTLQPNTPNPAAFTLAKAHATLNLYLELPNPQAGSRVSVTVTAPDGTAKTLNANAFLPLVTAQPTRDRIDTAVAGTYTVDASNSGVLAQDYKLSFCSSEVGPSDNPACPANG